MNQRNWIRTVHPDRQVESSNGFLVVGQCVKAPADMKQDIVGPVLHKAMITNQQKCLTGIRPNVATGAGADGQQNSGDKFVEYVGIIVAQPENG